MIGQLSQPADDRPQLARLVDRWLARAGVLANAAGAVVVFGFLIVLAPGVDQSDVPLLLVLNIPAFIAFLVAALLLALRQADAVIGL